MPKLKTPASEGGAAWDEITIAGVKFTGKIEVEGDLWKKKKDHHRARGRSGRRSVHTGWDVAEFTITLVSYDTDTDDELTEVLDAVTLRSPDASSHAIPIRHPALLAASITQATFEGAAAPKPDPGGTLTWATKWQEHRPPATADATRTVATAPQGAETQRAGRGVYDTAAGPEATPMMRPIPPPAPSSNP